MCANCSSRQHHFDDCPSTHTCKNCQGKHHSLLCNKLDRNNNTSRLNTGNPTRTYSNAVTSSFCGGTTLQTSVLSEVPAKTAPPVPRKCMRLGVLAVEICNPDTGEKKSIYAFQNTGSQMTLLRKSTMEEIGLHGTQYIQSCCRMNVMLTYF